MKPRVSAEIWLAFFFCLLAVVMIFVWIPLDTGTGLAEKVRRKWVIGDALGPTVAAVVIGLGGLFVALRPGEGQALSRANLMWMVKLLGLFVLAMTVMRYAGPLALSGVEGGYRPLRATAPYSYIGFVVGGTVMVGGLTALTCKRLAWKDFAIAFGATLAIALLYDLPFDDLLLPPNGDV